jgi:hypothetical protein
LSTDSWVDERNDTSKGSRGWESGVAADRRNANNERVEVLLGGNETTSSSDGSIAGSELGDNAIGLSEL